MYGERDRERERERKSRRQLSLHSHRDWLFGSSMNRFLFVLHFCETFSRHGIILVSSRFSAFVSLVDLRLFSTSQHWAVWCKAKAKSDMMSSTCLSVRRLCLWPPFLSRWYNIFRTPTLILVVTSPAYMLYGNTPPFCMPPKQFTWYFRSETTCVLFTLQGHFLSCHLRNLFGIFAREQHAFGNRCTSCYATRALRTAHG